MHDGLFNLYCITIYSYCLQILQTSDIWDVTLKYQTGIMPCTGGFSPDYHG